jgi:hypothetical protein
VLRYLLILLLFSSCSAKEYLTPEITALKEEDRDWVQVYRHEMKVAMEHDDEVAWHFFFWELLKEKSRIYEKSIDK